MHVIYEMNNMSIIVLGIPEKDEDKLEILDGVLGVQKDHSEATLQ